MIKAQRGIKSLKDLRDHLQFAIGLELTTIPAYLCALYSIRPGANSAACEAIQSVVLEEMLHMALAANVLNAIGGTPSTGKINRRESPVPVYPVLRVPYIDRIPDICLQAFSPGALDEFIAIEGPDEQDCSDSSEHPARRDSSGSGEQYGSIGEFYRAIKDAVEDHDLCPQKVFDDARKKRGRYQVSSADYYGGAGTLIEVTNRNSAQEALKEIIAEGEGLPPTALEQTARVHLRTGAHIPGPGHLAGLSRHDVDDDGELVVDGDKLAYGWKMYSHYARFKEIQHGRRYCPDQKIGDPPAGDILPIDWDAVRPMTTNPKARHYRRTWAFKPMMACNRTYTALVNATYRGFNGEHGGLRDAVRLMYELKYQADALLNMPSPLPSESGRTLGPAFEYLHDQNNRSR